MATSWRIAGTMRGSKSLHMVFDCKVNCVQLGYTGGRDVGDGDGEVNFFYMGD